MILRSLVIVATPYWDCSTLAWHHTRVWHDFSTRETWLTHHYVRRQRHMHTYIAEYRLFYRALLQKRPMILRSLLICDMTPSSVWHDSFKCVIWLLQVCDMTRSSVWHDMFKCVTWLVQVCDITRSSVWHDSFKFVTWLVQVCDMTCSSVWRDFSTCATWLIHTRDTTHPPISETSTTHSHSAQHTIGSSARHLFPKRWGLVFARCS